MYKTCTNSIKKANKICVYHKNIVPLRTNYYKYNLIFMKKWISYIVLILAIAIYSTVGILTRCASMYPFMSWQYVLFVVGAVGVLGVYAIIWQQLIQRMEISLAYMFKGLGVVFALLICHYVFDEVITTRNILGAVVIIAGITLFALADARNDGVVE